jgi:FerI (NUC094) domain/C2 domain
LGKKKTTEYQPSTENPILNEMLFFEFKDLKLNEIETGMIEITLLDHDQIGSNNMLGTFSIDMAYIYRMNKDHELYRMWIAMTDPSDEKQEINGYLRVTINVLGPGDKPPFHDPSKNLKNKNDNGINELFMPSRIKLTPHLIKFNVYRAEHLAPLNLLDIDINSYVKISFAGKSAESKTIMKNRNPSYNQELFIACKLPCMNELIKVEIWNDDVFTN